MSIVIQIHANSSYALKIEWVRGPESPWTRYILKIHYVPKIINNLVQGILGLSMGQPRETTAEVRIVAQ